MRYGARLFLTLAMAAACATAPAQVELFGGSTNLPQESWRVECAGDSAVRVAVSESPGSGIEGIWQATADGARVAVVNADVPGSRQPGGVAPGAEILFVVLRSMRPGIAPGTVMGWGKPAAKPGKWDVWLFTRCDGRTLSKPKQFTLTASDESHLQITPVKKGIKARMWRFLPYMFRLGITKVDTREKDLDGFLRVWPPSPSSPPVKPVYL